MAGHLTHSCFIHGNWFRRFLIGYLIVCFQVCNIILMPSAILRLLTAYIPNTQNN